MKRIKYLIILQFLNTIYCQPGSLISYEHKISKIEKYLAQSSNTYDLEHKIFELDKKGKYNQIYL